MQVILFDYNGHYLYRLSYIITFLIYISIFIINYENSSFSLLCFFSLITFFLFCSNYLGGFDVLSLKAGDSVFYHVPKIKQFINLEYDSNVSNTGIIFHFICAIFIKVIFFGNITEYNLIIFNILCLLFTGLLLVKIKKFFKIESPLIFLLLFNPFVLNWSTAIMKESLHILIIVLLIYFLINKKIFLYVLVSLILLVDRPYSVLYTLVLPIFFYSWNIIFNIKVLLFSIICVFTIDKLYGLQNLFIIYNNLQDRLYENRSASSLFTIDNPLINFTKVFFSPFPLRTFTYKANYFYELHFIFTFFFSYLFYRILRFNFLPVFYFILINLFLFPHEARQKLTYLFPTFVIFFYIYKKYPYKLLKNFYK